MTYILPTQKDAASNLGRFNRHAADMWIDRRDREANFRGTSKFADAVDEADVQKINELLCDVDQFHYLDNYDQATADSGRVANPTYRDLRVSKVDVRPSAARPAGLDLLLPSRERQMAGKYDR